MLLFFLGALLFAAPATSQNRPVVGWLERAVICPEQFTMQAKLDTGADNSSIDAAGIVEFERNGEKWVRFSIVNLEDKTVTIERKIHRFARIKQHAKKAIRRPVIRMGVCLGNNYREVEFNLADRKGFNFKMLLGRSFLKGMVVVDPALKFTTPPACGHLGSNQVGPGASGR